MCGIAGVIAYNRTSDDRTIVDRLTLDQQSRGPDFCATSEICLTPSVVFGHNRLTITDLHERSHQPMWDLDQRYCISFNGQIYNHAEIRARLEQRNHHFRTLSDTEVILESWKAAGPASLDWLNGMFAFAIWDAVDKKLHLVRDRFGVKPLYYCDQNNRIIFASTSRALSRVLQLKPSHEYAARGLRSWVYDDDLDTSPIAGVKALAPGTRLAVQAHASGIRSVVRRYYHLNSRVAELREQIAGSSDTVFLTTTKQYLASAVQLRYTSEVPQAISLSGGLDSGVLTALLLETGRRPFAISFGHPDEHESEGPLIAQFQRSRKFDVEWVWPTKHEIVDAFFAALEAQDAPFADASIVAQHLVFQRARTLGIKVMLGGTGGDETFLGYRKFPILMLLRLLRHRQLWKATQFAAGLIPNAAADFTGLPKLWRLRFRYSAKTRESLLRLPTTKRVDLTAGVDEPIWHRQVSDVLRFSLPTQLRYSDRNSMAHGIELRQPFLDHRVVEWGLALPDSLKWRNTRSKWILREILKGQLPEKIRRHRRKRGFYTNKVRWIRNGLGDVIRGELHRRRPAVTQLLRDGVTIDAAFSDDRLCHDPRAWGEATTVLFLAR